MRGLLASVTDDCEKWRENLVGAKCMALKLFFSSPIDTCEG